ncbi:hypothetical protein PIB30_088748 [Stylosanthes scabra]|uniref:Uncharacterized protein n=1 Tax=Stylosanthes scabra TaxID=79078 RepID=A0ABU6QW62_9FABA|nr:hypothetical protein [Stylosanthes scabra]
MGIKILLHHIHLRKATSKTFFKSCSKGREFWETQKRLEAQLATVTELVTHLVTPSVASTSITTQSLNSGDLPSQALSIARRSIPTLFLCANQEGREDTPLNEEDVENLNHEEVRECLEEVEEKNEDQEAEDVDHEVENKDKEQKGMEIVHSASSKATPSKLPSLAHNTMNPIENTKSKHWWRFIASIEALRSLVHVVWDTRDQCNNKNWWRFQEEFKHKPP